MNLNSKLIITSNETVKNKIINIFDFKNIYSEDFEVYKTTREKDDEIEDLILIFSNIEFIDDAYKYVKENYIFIKILVVWISKIVSNHDLQVWDIIIPNSFIDKNWENPIFMDNFVWENFDLNKFWLILSWISMNYDIENIKLLTDLEKFKNDYICDIVDLDSYILLKNLSKEEITASVVIRLCLEDDSDNEIFISNLINITEIIL